MTLFRRLISFLLLAFCGLFLHAQPKLEFDFFKQKPKQYEERKLGSEKSADKKFTFTRRVFQNTFTRYNYYFNANRKLNEILEQAKLSYKDDYTQLLAFYPYTLDSVNGTARAKGDIDSILYKCTAGILLHDLRNDWIDNMYLIMGKAYMLRQDFDSAFMVFQYLNTTFAPKEKDGYEKVIGSNQNEGTNAFTIATKEKKGMFAYFAGQPPSRNESFLGLIRTYIEAGEYVDASSLIEMLKNDPNYPKRLQEELYESRAYLAYKTQVYDSAAVWLGRAIPLAPSQGERARWYYLQGQMFSLAGMNKEASIAYDKCVGSALDPVMEVYARLNTIRLNKSTDPKVIDRNIAELMKMAKKDKYSNYRDIIYYAAALFELERNGVDAATTFLDKSVLLSQGNMEQKSRSFLLLADLNYDTKKYGRSGFYYDSVGTIPDSVIVKRVDFRKPPTKAIFDADAAIVLEDSLLRIANMAEDERNAYVRKVANRLRKEKGLKPEENTGAASSNPAVGANSKGPADIFAGNGTNGWYFNDVGRRANGFNTFKNKWGARANADNWRRSAAQTKSNGVDPNANPNALVLDKNGVNGSNMTKADLTSSPDFDANDISFDNLYSRLPLDAGKKARSETVIINALFKKGLALQNQIEDYPEAIKVFEEILKRRDTGDIAAQSVFHLIYAYKQTGDLAKSEEYKKMLQTKFAASKLDEKLKKPVGAENANPAATQAYKDIYNLFIEGKFAQAQMDKQKADSLYGKHYWTPQLLYIESVFYIREKQDSTAIVKLKEISTLYPGTVLDSKAKTMVEVLGRRKQIEDYLTKLEVSRDTSDDGRLLSTVTTNAPRPDPPKMTSLSPRDTSTSGPKITLPQQTPTVRKDSLNTVKITDTATNYMIDLKDPHMVAVVLNKVDIVYFNETLNSFNRWNRNNASALQVQGSKVKINDTLSLVLLNSAAFANAIEPQTYLDKVRAKAATEVLPWLDRKYYSFLIISPANLELLKQKANLAEYRRVLNVAFPGKF